jgi:hypothetical protein
LKRDQVLSCDSDVFHGNTPADLNNYLIKVMATQRQNWLYTWKPFIISSINSAKEESLRGVQHLTTYFPDLSEGPRRPRHNRPHRTARPRLREQRVLPHPAFRFRSLRSFFGLLTQSTPS